MGRNRPTVLLVEDEARIRKATRAGLTMRGFDVVEAANGQLALDTIAQLRPDAIVSDVYMPEVDGLTMLKTLRADRATADIPVIMLTSRASTSDISECLAHGADDHMSKPFAMDELASRVSARLSRYAAQGTLRTGQVGTDHRLLQADAFAIELEREIYRSLKSRGRGLVAYVDFHEADAIADRFGPAALAMLRGDIREAISDALGPADTMGASADGAVMLLLPELQGVDPSAVLRQVVGAVLTPNLTVGDEPVRVTPVVGHVPISEQPATTLIERARLAAETSRMQLDLEPRAWQPSMKPVRASSHAAAKPWWRRFSVPYEIALVHTLAFFIPLGLYFAADRYWIDIVPTLYLVVVGALVLTTALIWIEGLLALREKDPPAFHGTYPPAAAIIAAYLPNEAGTILDTIDAFLKVRYPGPLQIVLAYNTPKDMPVEDELRRLAKINPQLTLCRVANSTSKAQNVNYALSQVDAEMVALFDADHQPEPHAFTRAWRWLAAGNDVVQGHCLVRNGKASWVARMIAVEFELIYAVAHPGRARLHGFGIFGGTNGFWRADVLHRTRMHGFMLTEDIDSSIRAIRSGHKIINDPLIISRELAPTTLEALWNQRMRWAQGWFEVSLRHSLGAVTSRKLSLRNRIGIGYLMVWRELYPWIALQMYPILAYMAWQAGGAGKVDYVVPIFVLTTAVTMLTGPMQALLCWVLAHPDIRKEHRWFLWFMVTSIPYTLFKNSIGMIAQFRHARGDSTWRVTPRETESNA